MNDFKQWFLDQSPRDQVMLAVGGIAIGLYILLFIVLFPMQGDLDKKQKRNRAAMGEQQEVYDLAGQLKGVRESGGSQTGNNFNALLNQSLREFGLAMETFQPSGDAARIRLAPSEFNKVLAWLNELEVNKGIVVRDLSITADQNPGTVLVHLQLAQGE